MTGIFAILATSFLFGASKPVEFPTAARAEVEALLAELGGSKCEFYRNGSWHDGREAESHLRMKYEYLLNKGWIHTTEEFIEGAGTKSSLSGEPYQVKCPDHPAQLSAAYLTDRLRERRMVQQDKQNKPEKPKSPPALRPR